MIRDLVLRSVRKYGGEADLAERLLRHGENKYLTWVVRSIVDEHNVYDSLYTLSEVLDIPITKLRYAYFSAVSTPVMELRKLPEYDVVMETLNDIYPAPKLWESLQKYAFDKLKLLCIEELVARDETSLSIMDKLKVSNGLVYRIRSECIKRELKKKAEL